MPIYEFICTNCKNKFELMRSFSRSGEDADCPKCHKTGKRIMSACYANSSDSAGLTQQLGSGGGCASCGGGSCSTCGH